MKIIVDDLEGPEIKELLEEHLEEMYAITPPESVHALDLTELKKPDVTFWTVWEGDELAGCGALKEIKPGHGEIKSMRTAKGFLRRGVASMIVRHILEIAKQRGYARLSLETGSMKEFEAARSLYERFGFEECGPFEGYIEDPNSVFMTLVIS